MNKIDKEVYEKIARINQTFGGIINLEYSISIILSDVLNYLIKDGDGLWDEKENHKIPAYGVINRWDMSKPTYEEQDDKCKEFIRSLIK